MRRREAGAGQRPCNKEKWLIITLAAALCMRRYYLAGWKTEAGPNQYDYLLGDVVPIGRGSNGSAELKNNFTLISLSIVTAAHLLSEEF